MDETKLEVAGSAIPHHVWNPADLRTAAEPIAATWFALHGMNSFRPLATEPYDLLVETPAGFERVQVKSTTYRDVRGKYQAAIGKRRTRGPNKNRLLPYRTDEIDSFFIVDGELELYRIPVEEIGGRVCIVLTAWTRFKCGSARGLYGGAELN